jgi:hypothetical protein
MEKLGSREANLSSHQSTKEKNSQVLLYTPYQTPISQVTYLPPAAKKRKKSQPRFLRYLNKTQYLSKAKMLI